MKVYCITCIKLLMIKNTQVTKNNFSRCLDNELAVLQLPIATLKFICTHRKHQKIFLLKYCTIYRQQFYYRVGLCYYYVGRYLLDLIAIFIKIFKCYNLHRQHIVLVVEFFLNYLNIGLPTICTYS